MGWAGRRSALSRSMARLASLAGNIHGRQPCTGPLETRVHAPARPAVSLVPRRQPGRGLRDAASGEHLTRQAAVSLRSR